MKYILILLILLVFILSSCKTVYNVPVKWTDNSIEREDTLLYFEDRKAVIRTKEGFIMHISSNQIILE